MTPGWPVEEGRRLLAAPDLRRDEVATRGPEDKKWALGDLDYPDNKVEEFAAALLEDPDPERVKALAAQLRMYRRVAQAWPPGMRQRASWTTHRQMKDDAERFEKITPAMISRRANLLAGKEDIDWKPLRSLDPGEAAFQIVHALRDRKRGRLIRDEILKLVNEPKSPRAARALVNQLEREDALARKEAQRRLFRAPMRTAREGSATNLDHLRGITAWLAALAELAQESTVITDDDRDAFLKQCEEAGEFLWEIEDRLRNRDRPALSEQGTANTEVIDAEVVAPAQEGRP